MPATLVVHEQDPADAIWALTGDLDEIAVHNNKVLVGVYQRPKNSKTVGGIILTDETLSEDKYQSKVGLILRMGPTAFIDMTFDPPKWFVNQEMQEGDWVVYRPSDGFSVTLMSTGGKLLCRLLDDTSIMAKIDGPMGPDRVY
jgi:co-chaperonin GroES (HSP10)